MAGEERPSETRRMPRLIALLVPVLVLLLAAPAHYDAQAAKKQRTLATFRLTSAEGLEVELDSEQLKGQKLAICFLTSWSDMSVRQAKAVAAQARSADFDGKLVLICGGPERLMRGLRAEMNLEGALWLRSSTSMANDFREAFEPAITLDRVPALLVVDENRTVQHSSVGELTAEELAGVFSK